jgi:ribonuclease HI
MKRLDELLLLLAAGANIDEAWRKSGFSNPEEARKALRDLAGSMRTHRSGRGEAAGPNGAGSREPLGLIVYVDGASRGNPGPSSVGAVAFLPGGEELTSVSKPIGRATNNVAEYTAVLEGLKLARALNAREVEIRLDSELVARQLNGEYRIKNSNLLAISRSVIDEAARFDACRYVHVPRSENARADELANEALDREGSAP